jgi:hypothetical protein
LFVSHDETSTVDPLDTTITDDNGYWEVRSPDTADASREGSENAGYTNFEVDMMGNGVSASEFFSKQFVGGQWTSGTTPAPTARMRLARGVNGESPLPARRALMDVTDPPIPCSKTLTQVEHWQKTGTVGEIHTAGDVTENFVYGKQADSDIGVLVSPGGVNWTASGTAHVGNTLGSSVTWSSGEDVGYRTDTDMEVRRYHVTWTPSWCAADSYTTKVTDWNGGRSVGDNNHDLDHQCSTYPSDQVQNYAGPGPFDRTSGNMVTFSAGFTIFGVGVTSQNGWSSHVESHWHMGTGQPNHWLCGTNGPTTTAKRVLAGL